MLRKFKKFRDCSKFRFKINYGQLKMWERISLLELFSMLGVNRYEGWEIIFKIFDYFELNLILLGRIALITSLNLVKYFIKLNSI